MVQSALLGNSVEFQKATVLVFGYLDHLWDAEVVAISFWIQTDSSVLCSHLIG